MVLTGLLPAPNLSCGALLVVYGAAILLTVWIGSETFASLWGSCSEAGTGWEINNGGGHLRR